MSEATTGPQPLTNPPAFESRHAWLIPVLVVTAGVLLLVLILSRWNHWRSGAGLQKTNDAYVHALVTGTLRNLNVTDYQHVRAGQLIAKIDDADSRASLEQAEAALAAAQAQLEDNQVQKQVQRARIAQAREQEAESDDAVSVAAGQRDGASAQSVLAAQERRRQEAMYASAATTRQTLEQAVSADDSSRASLHSADANLSKATDATRSARTVIAQAQQELRLLGSKDNDLHAPASGGHQGCTGATQLYGDSCSHGWHCRGPQGIPRTVDFARHGGDRPRGRTSVGAGELRRDTAWIGPCE